MEGHGGIWGDVGVYGGKWWDMGGYGGIWGDMGPMGPMGRAGGRWLGEGGRAPHGSHGPMWAPMGWNSHLGTALHHYHHLFDSMINLIPTLSGLIDNWTSNEINNLIDHLFFNLGQVGIQLVMVGGGCLHCTRSSPHHEAERQLMCVLSRPRFETKMNAESPKTQNQ